MFACLEPLEPLLNLCLHLQPNVWRGITGELPACACLPVPDVLHVVSYGVALV
jgi:hypothetical protein